MALSTQSALLGGSTKNVLVAVDPNSNLAAAHVTVNASGAEVGTSASPFVVSVGNLPTTQPVTGAFFQPVQPVSLSALPSIPAGSATIGAVSQAGAPWSVSWTGQSVALTGALPAGSNSIGAVTVSNSVGVTGTFFPATQPISAVSLPLPTGAAQDGADSTGVVMPTGGSGLRGWLSGIYARLGATLSVSLSTALPTGSNTIGAVTGAGTFTVNGQGNTGVVPAGSPHSVAGVDAAGLKQHLRTDTFGTPSDGAWSSGSGSLVSLGKALVAAQQATTAAVTSSSLVPPSPSFVQTAALASNLVLKAGPGSLYACYVTTGATPGWLMLLDSISLPSNGTVTPKNSIYCPANATTQIELPILTPEPFAIGITAAFSSTGPFTLTASSTAFIKGVVQ